MKVIFNHHIEESATIRTFYFKPDRPVRYTAGQFVELMLPHEPHDNRGIKRWFTLSSSPTEDLLSITTRLDKQNGSTYKKTLAKLTPGIEVNLSDPMGDFVLPKRIQTPLIFIAAGIGVTPFRSIISWLHSTKESRPITFLYAVRNEEDILFLPTFEKANVHVTLIVEEPSAAWGGERGTLQADMIRGLGALRDDSLVYVSGPERIVEKVVKDLKTSGIPQRQLVTDYFHGYKNI